MELTKQEKLKLIELFEFLLDEEVSKPLGQMNSETVNYYVEILLDLQDKHVELSPEYIHEQVRKIFHPEDFTAPETVKTTKKQYNKKKVWLVAACIAILVALFSIISVANDWNVFDFLTEKFGSVHSVPIEDGVDFNGITITNHGKRTKHKTIEDALKSNDINILYPTILPNNISVTDIMLFEKDSKNKIIYFYSDPNLHSEISLNTQLSKAVKNGASEKTTINSIDCYICKMPDMQLVQIEFEFNGNYYMFTHTDKDILIEIIENLEEINNEN